MDMKSAVPAACNERPENKLQIVLVGTSGSGKSATGNTIIEKKNFKSFPSDKSVTEKCQKELKNIGDMEITIIDTPGCHCTRLPHDQVITQLKEVIATLTGPYAFLLVVPAVYFTPQENETVSMLQEALGESYLSHTVIIFSQVDNLSPKTRDEFIAEGNKELQELITKCGGRYHFINNRIGRNEAEVEQLLSDLEKVAKLNEMLISQEPVEKSNIEVGKEVKKINQCLIIQDSKEMQLLANTCLMVLGIKGVGKTATIRSILPEAEPTQHEGCSIYSDGQMKVVECPGFDQDPGEIRDSIQRGLRVCAPGPHVILIVMKVDRFSPATKQTMLHVQTELKEAAQKPVIFLFTRKADLEGKSIDKFIQECEDLQRFVCVFGSRHFALENRDADKQSQVKELINMIAELLKTNNKTIYTGEEQHSELQGTTVTQPSSSTPSDHHPTVSIPLAQTPTNSNITPT